MNYPPLKKPALKKPAPALIKRSTLLPSKTKTESNSNKEFFVSDEYGNFWCGYRNGMLYWSDQISQARELVEETHFNSLVRWERGNRNLKKEYL